MKPKIYLLLILTCFAFNLKAQKLQNPYLDSMLVLQRQSDFKGALEYANKAVDYNPQDNQSYYQRGFVDLMLGKYTESLADYDNALTVLENQKTTLPATNYELTRGIITMGRAQVLWHLGRSGEAIKVYTDAIENKKFLMQAYIGRAEVYHLTHKYKEAVGDNTKVIEMNSKIPTAYLNRAAVYRDMHKYKEAIADYTKVLSLNTTAAFIFRDRARCYEATDSLENAVADYTKLIELKPNVYTDFDNRAHNEARMGLYAEATADYNKALMLKPNYEYALRGLATIQYWQGNYKTADSLFTLAIEYSPKIRFAYEYRGVLEYKTGKFNEALSDLNKAIMLSPKEPYAYSATGEAQIYAGNYKEAIDALQKSIMLAKDSATKSAWNYLGYAYFKLGDCAKAVAYYDTAKLKGSDEYIPYLEYRDEAALALKNYKVPAFTHLQWVEPVADVNLMYHGTIITHAATLAIRVKVYSTNPIVTQDIMVVIDNQTLHPRLKNMDDVKLNLTTKEYEYEYAATVDLPKGQSTVTVKYDNKTAQQLKINLVP